MRSPGGLAPRLALTAGLLWASAGHTQAWLPDGGESSFGVSYTDTFDKKHWTSTGGQVDAGHVRIYTYGFAVAYSPTDSIMLDATLPLVSSEYHGARPHPTEVDDGSYHATFTDLRTAVHYQLSLEPVAVAPYVAYVLPTHNYETLGHAAPGRGLHETWLGVAVGMSLDKWVPRTFVQSRFTYAIVEKVAGVSHDKENIEFNVGYYLTPDVSAQAYVNWQKTLGGIDVPIPPSNPLFPHHDQLAADDFTNVGVGGQWYYSDHSTVSLAYMEGVSGRNGHKIGRAVSIGYSYGFFGFRPH